MDASQVVLLATVLLPFAGAGAVILLRKLPNAREGASLAAAVGTFALAGMSLPAAFQGGPVEVTLAEMLEGLSLSLRADGLGLLFAVLASFLWILTTVYSVGYMRGLKEHAQTRYFACFALVIGATMGVALSANLFSLFLFYEILTVATYPLVVHKETEEAFAAGRKYLVYTLTAGVAILAGMTLLQGMAGSVEFVAGGNPALAGLAPEFAKVAFVLLLGGFGVKAALVPLHGWLPTAMIAPTPVSGLLHAVAVVKAGVFGLLRTILFLFGPGLMVGLDLQVLVIVTACATILVGSLLALVQDDLKARLAYSTISALSYILLGAALVDPTTGEYPTAAIVGATFQIAAHAFAKLTMFFVAGAIAVETGKTRISELDGIGRRMPGTMVAFTVATIGMAGLPPLAGFLGKWYLGVGAWGAFGQDGWPLLLVLATSSVLNLAYFLPIVVRAFFGPSEGPRTEARGMLLGPLLGTAVGGLVLGLWTSLPYGPFELARLIAADVTGAGPAAFTFVADLVLPVPPFLVFLIGAPLVLALKGRARQVALVGVAGLGLVDVILMPAVDAAWTVPFMDGELVLLHADGLSLFAGYIFAIITFLACLYAAAFARPWLHAYALLYAGASLGAVFAGDWISVLIFWEVMAVASTLLVWESRGEAIGAGYRYLLFHGLGGALLGAGIALTFLETGDLALGAMGSGWAAVLTTLGIGVNAAFIPLHTWLPDTYPRTHVATSVFLSVYTTKAAVYLLARTFYGEALGPQDAFLVVAFMGAAMAVYGVSFAVVQNNMRRLLSYHIVSQVGYMIAGVGLAGTLGAYTEVGALGLNGGMAHMFNNLLYKTLLFMTVGVVVWRTGEQTLDRLGGLQRRMPVTAWAFWIAALSISGVPLFNGYVSKGMVITAAEDTNLVLWILLEIASFGTFLSFLKIGWFAFLRPSPKESWEQAKDPPPVMQAAMVGTAALCVVLGVYYAAQFAVLPVLEVEGAAFHYEPYDLVRLASTLLVLGAAAAFFFGVGRKILAPHDTRLRDADVAYVAAGVGLGRASAALQASFGGVYAGAVATAASLFAAGRGAMRLEDRDVNWNVVAYGAALVAVLGLLFLGVGA